MSSLTPDTPDRWQHLIDELYAAFSKLGHPISIEIVSENALRSHLERLCRERRHRYPTHILFKLQTHGIDAFTGALDGILDRRPPNTLAGLAYGGIFAVTMSGCNAGLQLVDIVEAMAQLNHAIPRLGTEIPRSSYNLDVQRHLQDIFHAYMDSLVSLAGYFSNHSSDPNRLKPQNAINYENFANLCREKGKKLDAALRQAESEMKRWIDPMMRRHNTHGILDVEKHPYDTHARFKTIRRLGHGSFGSVDEVKELTTGNVYARKNILLGREETTASRRLEVIEREFRIMEQLTHSHITTVMFWLREDDHCSIIMKPACDTDLRSHLEQCTRDQNPPHRLSQLLRWPGCLLKALSFAHRRNIIHKDIKPSNILIKDDQVYLADFGMARDDLIGQHEANSSFSQWGHAVYRAPEVIPGHSQPRGSKADVFSLGCVFTEMLTVAASRSLIEYRNFRSTTENEYDLIPFRTRLDQVKIWLDSLRDQCIDSTLGNILIWQTGTMLHPNPDMRASARDGIKFLDGQRERDSLYCSFEC